MMCLGIVHQVRLGRQGGLGQPGRSGREFEHCRTRVPGGRRLGSHDDRQAVSQGSDPSVNMPGVLRRQDDGGGAEAGGDVEQFRRRCPGIQGHERRAQGPGREQQRQAVGPVACQREDDLILPDSCVDELGEKTPMKRPEIRSRQPIAGRRKVNQDTSRMVPADVGEPCDDRVQISHCRSPRVRRDGEARSQVYCSA